MSITCVFHTNDTWTRHRILWSGHYIASGASLFGDAFSQYIVGQHSATLSGYPAFGSSVTLTRLITNEGKLGIAGSTPSGIPYTIVGPTTDRYGGKLAHYLDEYSTSLGSLYIETSPASGNYGYFNDGMFHWHPKYPPSGNWLTVSGIGYAQNDVIGLDYPDNPRVLVSTSELANPASGIASPGVMVINVASGAMQELRYQTYFASGIAKNLKITDLEAQRILG